MAKRVDARVSVNVLSQPGAKSTSTRRVGFDALSGLALMSGSDAAGIRRWQNSLSNGRRTRSIELRRSDANEFGTRARGFSGEID